MIATLLTVGTMLIHYPQSMVLSQGHTEKTFLNFMETAGFRTGPGIIPDLKTGTLGQMQQQQNPYGPSYCDRITKVTDSFIYQEVFKLDEILNQTLLKSKRSLSLGFHLFPGQQQEQSLRQNIQQLAHVRSSYSQEPSLVARCVGVKYNRYIYNKYDDETRIENALNQKKYKQCIDNGLSAEYCNRASTEKVPPQGQYQQQLQQCQQLENELLGDYWTFECGIFSNDDK